MTFAKVGAFLGIVGAAVYAAGMQVEAIQTYKDVVFALLGLG